MSLAPTRPETVDAAAEDAAEDATAEDATAETAGETAGEAGETADAPGGRRRSLRGPVLAALCVAMLVAGGLLLVLARGQADDARSVNRALYDASTTTEVEGQIGTGLARVLTFDHRRPEATRAAADELMRGKAREQYDELYAALVDLAPQQQLSTRVEVRATAVQELEGDRAEVLVFLDQTSTRGTDGESSVGAAQVQVSAQRIDGAWRVLDLDLR